MVAYHFTGGDTDVLMIVEADSQHEAAKVALIAASSRMATDRVSRRASSTAEFAGICRVTGAQTGSYVVQGS